MVPLLVQEVNDWCRENLRKPVEIVDFVVEIPTPRAWREPNPIIQAGRRSAAVLPGVNTDTLITRGYAIEFGDEVDAVHFKLRWG